MANECLKNLPQWVWLVIGIIIFVALFKTFKNKQIISDSGLIHTIFVLLWQSMFETKSSKTDKKMIGGDPSDEQKDSDENFDEQKDSDSGDYIISHITDPEGDLDYFKNVFNNDPNLGCKKGLLGTLGISNKWTPCFADNNKKRHFVFTGGCG